MKIMSKLEDCAFCGGFASVRQENRGQDEMHHVWVVSCDDCPCEMVGNREDSPTDHWPDELELITKAWNYE